MILNKVRLADTDELVNISITDELITEVSSSVIETTDTRQLTFNEAIVFPGLINSHDHLDFNLFPKLGDKIYNSYTEWGKYIHEAFKDQINEVLKVPHLLRLQWGVYKNLLGGVTTVVNHGECSGLKDDLITIFEDAHCLHSVQFEKNWKIKLNNPLKVNLTANIHVGEGSDWSSFHEIDQLTAWNLLHRDIVGVHAVAMTEKQAKKFKAIIWCPQSNYFLLNKTARVNLLKEHTNLLFGTDSTLTGNWDIWDHLRTARMTNLVSDEALYQALTLTAAKVWKLNSGEIAPRKYADIIVAKTKIYKTGFDAFFAVDPADLLMVIHRGSIRLFDETLLTQLQQVELSNFSKVYINGAWKYIQGDLPGLIEKIKAHYPKAGFPVSTNKAAYL